jgi:hypothetical protein
MIGQRKCVDSCRRASYDMATHMKTTIDIADELLREAKSVAHRKGTTLRALMEAGLRHVLGEFKRPRKASRIKPVTVKGRGLTPEAQRLGAHAMILALYDER